MIFILSEKKRMPLFVSD